MFYFFVIRYILKEASKVKNKPSLVSQYVKEEHECKDTDLLFELDPEDYKL